MESQLKYYFKAEKHEALIIMLIGLFAMAIGLAAIFYWQGDIWRGFCIPLIAISMIQITAGSTIYFRTNRQVRRLLNQLKEAPEKLVLNELPRMEKVNKSFRLYRSIELSLVLLGLFFSFMGAMGSWGAFVLGTGLGLALQSGIMLVFDLFAEWRAGFYTYKIHQLGKELGVVS